ncbi:hypothetical protein [Planococcus sp. YIM B11945]|uniref:hypothetical protein n=1 Tax=Planococcus sp. YIM B11945 TaxID=3435410 RepID=UPI003D7D81B9
MSDSYVLKIADLHTVLNPKEIVHWEVFLKGVSSRYEKIDWNVTASADGLTLENVHLFYGQLHAVEIDFRKGQIVFYKGGAASKEFTEFLTNALANMFVHINSDQLHFLVASKYSLQK